VCSCSENGTVDADLSDHIVMFFHHYRLSSAVVLLLL